MEGAVGAAEAGERLRTLQELQARHTRERLEACRGRETEVLVEGRSTRDSSRLCGRTPCYKMVNFSPAPGAGGSLRRVVIRDAGPHSLSGEEGGSHG